MPLNALAYCADLTAERVLFTHHKPDELAPLFSAPFLFVEQLRLAAGVTTVPFERLAEIETPDNTPGPVLVFSPGRTGSTLLVRLLTTAGLGCASEPDMLTQLARMACADRRRLPTGMEKALARACLGALSGVLGPGAAIKLRSHCSARPLTLVQAAPGCRAVFMLRGMTDWSLSRHRVFQESPDDVAAVLRQALDALNTLEASGIAVEVLWFETLLADPIAALNLVAPGLNTDPVHMHKVMQADSQAGTWIAQSVVAGRPIQADFKKAFTDAWQNARSGAVWSERTERLLSEMWNR